MTEAKKRGRPPKPVAERRRHNQTFRCNDDMLSRLQMAADRNQRSISEEVERRLEDSFTQPEIVKAAAEAASSAAMAAAFNFFTGFTGEKRYLNVGISFGNALRHAMNTTGLGEIEIRDVHKHPKEKEWIKNYINKCLDDWFMQFGLDPDYDVIQGKMLSQPVSKEG